MSNGEALVLTVIVNIARRTTAGRRRGVPARRVRAGAGRHRPPRAVRQPQVSAAYPALVVLVVLVVPDDAEATSALPATTDVAREAKDW